MGCGCETNKPKCGAKSFPNAVVEINNPETLVLLRKVVIPASMGTEEQVPPAIGKYHNVLLQYEANGHIYLYSSDGIPTAITADIPQEVLDSIEELEDDVEDLQEQIDDLRNSPDVVDIVPTYAVLQAYDTSKLGDNDIIRVLTDETHDGASSYYRWDKQTETWTYIGSVQTAANTIFYADLSETGSTRHIYKSSDMTGTVSVQELLDANEDGQVILRMSSAQTPENFNDAYLQNTYVGVDDYQFLFLDNRNYYEYDGTATTDTSYYYSKSTIQLELTAGNNITITGNTISATDTTYSNFTGATMQQAGTSGLVPAPTTSDPDRYLKGDGSWGTPTDTTYTAGTNVQISAQNVISATDTTYSNFVGTDGQTAGTAGLVPAPATTDAGKFLKADGTWDAAGGAETFGYRKLTVDDYNWNSTTNTTENPDCIALWLLPSGVYYGPNSSEVGGTNKVRTSRTHSAHDPSSHVWRVYHASGTGVAHIYEWYSGNNRYIRCYVTYTTPANSSGNPGTGTTADGATIQTSDILATTAGTGTVAITQNAATSLVFADPGTRYKVRIGGTAAGTNATSVGRSASASGENSIALGSYANASTKGEMNIGTSTEATGGYNSTSYRLLTGLYDPQSAHDAATKGYVDTAVAGVSTNTISSQDWSTLWQ